MKDASIQLYLLRMERLSLTVIFCHVSEENMDLMIFTQNNTVISPAIDDISALTLFE